MAMKTNPIPTRYDEPEAELIEKIHTATGMPKAEIIRRAVKFSLPKFQSGKVNIHLYGVKKKKNTAA